MAEDLNRLAMTPEDLRIAGVSLFGDAPGWQSRLAENLGVDRSAVTRWLSGTSKVPMTTALLMRYMLAYGEPNKALL